MLRIGTIVKFDPSLKFTEGSVCSSLQSRAFKVTARHGQLYDLESISRTLSTCIVLGVSADELILVKLTPQ